jgi:uncharacterized protein YkwD
MNKIIQFLIGSSVTGMMLMWPFAPTAPYTAETVVDGINVKREEAKAPDLTVNAALSYAAYLKALDMEQRGYFAHHLKGEDTWQFVRQTDYDWLILGEDLAIDYKTPGDTVDAWMDSRPHRLIMLDKRFKDVGVGVVCDLKQHCIVVAEFGTLNKK